MHILGQSVGAEIFREDASWNSLSEVPHFFFHTTYRFKDMADCKFDLVFDPSDPKWPLIFNSWRPCRCRLMSSHMTKWRHHHTLFVKEDVLKSKITFLTPVTPRWPRSGSNVNGYLRARPKIIGLKFHQNWSRNLGAMMP